MKQYLAIDIGGTAVKLGIVDEEGRVLSKTEQSVCFDNYETPILTTVLSAAEQFLKEQAVEPQGLAGIGVSAAGQIDTRKGIVAGTCGSLPNYIGSPIKAELEAKFVLHLRRVGLLGAVRRNHRSGAGRTAPEPEVEGWPRYL